MREIAPFGLRLTPILKSRLDERARAAGRSLQKEIVMRLESSLCTTQNELHQNTATYNIGLSDSESEMLRLFREWPAEKQLGFLTLFK